MPVDRKAGARINVDVLPLASVEAKTERNLTHVNTEAQNAKMFKRKEKSRQRSTLLLQKAVDVLSQPDGSGCVRE